MKVIGLTKAYGGNVVLNNLNIEFRSEKANIIMGASGCGKTTLLRIISGLETADRGEVKDFLSKRVSFMFQEDRLLKYLNPVKNVSIVTGKGTSETEIAENLLKVGLTPLDFTKPCSAFSGGMARRVAIVRTVMFPCDIIILDEPFKGLDDDTKKITSKYLADNLNSRTLIAVTHDLEDFIDFDINLINL